MRKSLLLPHSRRSYEVCTIHELALAAHRASQGQTGPFAVSPDDWISVASPTSRKKPSERNATALDDGDKSSFREEEMVAAGSYRYRFNSKGRVVLSTVADREILVVMDPRDVEAVLACGGPTGPSTSFPRVCIGVCDGEGAERPEAVVDQCPPWIPRVYALDKNCYHIGYPIDLGAIEEIAVETCQADARRFICISCPLHNRLFDMATGNLIGVDYSRAAGSAATSPPEQVIASGKRAGGVLFSAGCHQRPHRVVVRPTTGTIVVFDSSLDLHPPLPSDEQNGDTAKPFD
jgi:nitrite reductase/ring-hydroxylating ferredoxin subunit